MGDLNCFEWRWLLPPRRTPQLGGPAQCVCPLADVRVGSKCEELALAYVGRSAPDNRIATLLGAVGTEEKCQNRLSIVANTSLFDHLVGAAEQRRRHGKTERFRHN